jgi:hypothetical protein
MEVCVSGCPIPMAGRIILDPTDTGGAVRGVIQPGGTWCLSTYVLFDSAVTGNQTRRKKDFQVDGKQHGR